MNNVVDAVFDRLDIYRSNEEHVNKHKTLYLLFDSNSTMNLHEIELQIELNKFN